MESSLGPRGPATQLADPIFVLAGLQLNVPMGDSQAITGVTPSCRPNGTEGRLVIGTGHYHSHTSVFQKRGLSSSQRFPIIPRLQSPRSLRPTTETWYFDSAKQNPEPSAARLIKRRVQPASSTCSQPGDSNRLGVRRDEQQPALAGIKFANAVYTGEMYSMFGMYVPSLRQSLGRRANF